MFLSNWFALLATVTSSGGTEKKTVLKSTYLMSYFFSPGWSKRTSGEKREGWACWPENGLPQREHFKTGKMGFNLIKYLLKPITLAMC